MNHFIFLFTFILFELSFGVSIFPDEKNQSNSLSTPSTVEKVVESPNNNYDKHDIKEFKPSEKLIDDDFKKDKKRLRTIPENNQRDKFNCCGSKYENSGRPDSLSQLTTRASDTDRYSSEQDKFSWHSLPGKPGNESPVHSDRYGPRPPYNRPGGVRPGYGYGYGGYNDNGAYGSQGFPINHRPGSIHFNGGGGNRPNGGGYGIYGTVGEQDEFPAAEDGPVSTVLPAHPNIHTQKAVALKALAGVALIGAAAALAANPVLLPVGVLAGRKRRSVQPHEIDFIEFADQFLLQHIPNINQSDEVFRTFWNSPECIDRITCQIQREYLKVIKSNPSLQKHVRKQLKQLIDNNMLSMEYIHKNIKTLTKIVNSKNEECTRFVCSLYQP